jgi:hypothetical protein
MGLGVIFTFRKPPPGGRPAGARSRRMPPQARLGLGGKRQAHASIVFLLPKLACDALDRAGPDPK